MEARISEGDVTSFGVDKKYLKIGVIGERTWYENIFGTEEEFYNIDFEGNVNENKKNSMRFWSSRFWTRKYQKNRTKVGKRFGVVRDALVD